MVFSIRASCWCRFAAVAAVWLLLGSRDTGKLAAQTPQPRPIAANAATVDDDAYWAQATTAKAADHWAQSRASTSPVTPGATPAMPAGTPYPGMPYQGTANAWPGYPQPQGMYAPPFPQGPVEMQGAAGAYAPAYPGTMGHAVPQPAYAAQQPGYAMPQPGYTAPPMPGAQAGAMPSMPYPATAQPAEPAASYPAMPAYPSTAANVGVPAYASPPSYSQPPAHGTGATAAPAAAYVPTAPEPQSGTAAPPMFGAPPLAAEPAQHVAVPNTAASNAVLPGNYSPAAPTPYQAPQADRATTAGAALGWEHPFGAPEHPLLQANTAVDYRSRATQPAAESTDPRYGNSADEVSPPAQPSQPTPTPPPTTQAAVQTPANMAPAPAANPGDESVSGANAKSPEELLRNLLNINGDRCLATVGPEVILLSEILPEVDKMLEPYKDKAPPDALEMQRILLIQKLLAQHIDVKLLLVDLKNKVPKDNLPKLRDQFLEPFEEKEVPALLKQYEASNRSELDQKMRAEGQSLVQYRQQFIDRTMAGTWARQQIKRDKEITHQDMVDYYRAHLSDYEFPAKARWEQLTVDFGSRRSKEEAYRRIAMLGNMVLDGMPFAEVAKQHSDGPTASEGGQRDWTTQGSLVCEALDKALFELPVGQLSPIIEDRSSFHIIRVQERQAAGRVDFLEAQADIRKKLQTADRSEQVREYIEKLRKNTEVWTIFDEFKQEVAQEPPRTIY